MHVYMPELVELEKFDRILETSTNEQEIRSALDGIDMVFFKIKRELSEES